MESTRNLKLRAELVMRVETPDRVKFHINVYNDSGDYITTLSFAYEKDKIKDVRKQLDKDVISALKQLKEELSKREKEEEMWTGVWEV